MMVPKVKICCIQNIEEARVAVNAGADILGLVTKMPSGPGVIEEKTISEIVSFIPLGISTFLLTSMQEPEAIIEQHNCCRTTSIQICDDINPGSYNILRKAMPGIKLIQVIHVSDEGSIEKAKAIEKFADAILLDSGNQKLEIKELGGTGRVHNWDTSRKIRESLSIPVFLAGGLNSVNILEAIKIVQPYGVDVCTGVRSDGTLDKEKTWKFINKVRLIK